MLDQSRSSAAGGRRCRAGRSAFNERYRVSNASGDALAGRARHAGEIIRVTTGPIRDFQRFALLAPSKRHGVIRVV